MRLLLINYEYPPLGGGAGNATANIARELATMGNDVVVLTSAFKNLPRHEQVDGFTIIRVPVLRRYMDRCSPFEMVTFTISATFAAIRLVPSWKPDASIAFFGIPSAPISWVLKFIYHIPYLVSLRGGDVPGFPLTELATYHLLTRPIIHFFWRHATYVVANSEGLRSIAQGSISNKQIEMIPNGVDTEKFYPAPTNPERSSGLNQVRLLIVGRLVRQKGLDILFKAMTQFTSTTLEIVGDGQAKNDLESLATTLNLNSRVHFVNWLVREHLLGHYHSADIFVFPSRAEGMPNVLLEAMASGLPVIATQIAGNEELVQDGETGLLIPVEDVDALSQALSRLIADPALRRRMGAAGRARVERDYSWRHVAKSYLHLIQEL